MFSPFYDAVFGASLQAARRIAVAALQTRAGERVLEVCVGTGFALPLYPRAARVTGVDISRDMLRRAASRVERLGLSHVEALLQMNAERLAFASGSFDKVTILFALSGLPNPVRALDEIQRVCRPGGTIVIANHFRSDDALLRLCEGVLSPVYRLLQYRGDLDLPSVMDAARLEVRQIHRANMFGYASVLVCASQTAPPRINGPLS